MDVEKYFSKAEEALKKKNHDLAIEVLKNQILKVHPDNVKARKLLRIVVEQKHKHSGTPAASKAIGSRIKLELAKAMKKWDTVLEEAENFLLIDSQNEGVLMTLGQACLEKQYFDAAISVYENVLKVNNRHVGALKQLGTIYEVHVVDLQKAQNYFEKASKADPTDHEASKKVKNISASITSGSYVNATSSKDLIKDKDRAKELEEEGQLLRTDDDIKRAIERCRKRLEADPESKKELRKLGDLYFKLRKYDDATNIFSKVLQLDPTSFDVKSKISECKIARCDYRLKEAHQQYKQNPQDPQVQQNFKKARKEKILIEIKEYQKLIESQPTNDDLRFKLGKSLFQGGNYDDAIANFQYSVKNPGKKIDSMIYMGQAFIKKSEFDLAEEQFKNALTSHPAKDKKHLELLYNLGLCYEASQRSEDAISTFTEIRKLDIKYKDVDARIKALRG